MKRLGMVAAVLILLFLSAARTAADEKIDLKAFEKTVDRALKAYNDDDSKKFWAEFAKIVDAIKTKETFDALYVNGYKPIFGKFVKLGDLIKEKTVLDGEIGAVFWKAEFEKNKTAYIAVNWMKEGNDVKLVQLQIQKQE